MNDNGINRRGQKVECIVLFEVVVHTDAKLTVPEPHKVYTVDDFVLSGKVVGLGELDTAPGVAAPGITLNEVPTPACECCGQVLGWPIVGFRPIVHSDKKADLSALVEAADKVTLPKREDVKVTKQANAIIAHGGAVLRALRQQRAVLGGDRPGEALLTPRQLAALQGFAPHFADQGEAAIEACAILETSVDKAADEITREFVRTFIIPWLAKRLGLKP